MVVAEGFLEELVFLVVWRDGRGRKPPVAFTFPGVLAKEKRWLIVYSSKTVSMRSRVVIEINCRVLCPCPFLREIVAAGRLACNNFKRYYSYIGLQLSRHSSNRIKAQEMALRS